MKNSGLLIAAIVLAALSGALYWSNRHPASENTAKASIDTPPKILTLKQEDISKIQIKKKGGGELDLAKGDAGKWQITAPKPLGADQEAVSSLLSSLSSLNSDRLVEDKAADLGQYGLTQPSLELDVTTKDSKPQKLLPTNAPFTALFAFNDISTIGAIRALREAARRVAEDVSVAGFDDIQSATFQSPGLTTVR